jgi:hypothetical protein
VPTVPRPIASWNPERDVWESEVMDLFSGLSDVYSETFPSSGSMRNGSVYERPTSAHLTDGSACSSSPGLLPTPVASDTANAPGAEKIAERSEHSRGVKLSEHLLRTPTAQLAVNGGSQHPDKRKAGGHGPTLADEVEHLLPTPSVADGMGGHLTRSGSRSEELLLPGVAKSLAEGPLLPTPRATDGTKGGPNQRGSSGDLMLPSAVMLLPTPTAMDSKASGGSTPADVTLTDAVVRTEMGTQPNPRLMPTPRVGADRTSRSAATRRDSRSAPSLGQAVEIAQGILPREFISWEELPPSWHGDRTATPSNDGKPS